MEESGHTPEPQGAPSGFGAPRLLFGLPLAGFAIVVLGMLALAVFLGVASPSCEEPVGELDSKVPQRLAPIYVAAATEYRLGPRGPAILAAINWVETAFGANLNVSSAGARGWMQFMPATWQGYGVDANGDGTADPYNPRDAIFAAANYLHASGAPGNWHDAIYAYNHAEWYVEKVERAAERYSAPGSVAGSGCAAAAPADAVLGSSVRLYAPQAFKPLPTRLWIGYGVPQAVDARIWPNAVWLLETYSLRVTAARESGHQTHGDGTAIDAVPAPGRGWDGTAMRAALALGWRPSCGASGTAPVCPLAPAIQFVAYNGFSDHGDPAHAGSNAHIHISWKSSDYGCPGLCAPREWVEVFPWLE
jgi:Transglycosylase SLT domain